MDGLSPGLIIVPWLYAFELIADRRFVLAIINLSGIGLVKRYR